MLVAAGGCRNTGFAVTCLDRLPDSPTSSKKAKDVPGLPKLPKTRLTGRTGGQSIVSGSWLISVFISKREHAFQVALVTVGKSALGSEGIRFLKGAEQTIPPRNVPVVELMDIQLMMDGMMLRTLQDVSNPVRRTKVTVVEVLA
jgi:hypothetical protein